MFFLVFVLFTSRWSVRKVLDCFFNMHLCAKLQPYSSNNFDLYGWKCFYKRLKQNELVVFNPPRSHGEHRALLLRLFSDESTKVADAPRSTQRAIRNKA